MFELVKVEWRPMYSVCGGDQVHYVKSMTEINLEYIYRPDVSNRVYVSAQHGVNGWHVAKTRGVQILDIVLGMTTLSMYMMNVGGKVSRSYEVKEWYLIQKSGGSNDAIAESCKIWNRLESCYELFRNWTLEINAKFSDNLHAHVFVNSNYEGKMRYRNRTRESSDAMYRSFGRRLSCTNLYVICVIVEIKNSLTELLNVNGVISGQCGACGRNVSVKKFSQ
jgi:hypothetical protein